MAINGVTFNKQLYSSQDLRVMQRRFFANQDGSLIGCEISSGNNNILIERGYFIVSGGLIYLTTQEIVAAGSSGTKKLCFRIDLTKENTESNFSQGYFLFNSNPRQDDLFNGGSIYDLPFADVVTNGNIITSITILLKEIDGDIIGLITELKNKVITLEEKPAIYNGDTAPTEPFGKDGDIFVEW